MAKKKMTALAIVGDLEFGEIKEETILKEPVKVGKKTRKLRGWRSKHHGFYLKKVGKGPGSALKMSYRQLRTLAGVLISNSSPF